MNIALHAHVVIFRAHTNKATRDATTSNSNATQPTPQQIKAYLQRRTSMPSASTSRQCTGGFFDSSSVPPPPAGGRRGQTWHMLPWPRGDRLPPPRRPAPSRRRPHREREGGGGAGTSSLAAQYLRVVPEWAVILSESNGRQAKASLHFYQGLFARAKKTHNLESAANSHLWHEHFIGRRTTSQSREHSASSAPRPSA